MFASTIIATIGRPTLTRSVESSLQQPLSANEHEIIVVNDSGSPLVDAEWQQSAKVRIVHTNRRERSVARNTGAAVARGHYLHFLDDDDWLLDGALKRLQSQAAKSEATWVYGGSRLVDRQGAPLLDLHHSLTGNCFTQVMAGEWIPLQASLVRADVFFEAGGFNPLLSGPEDIDLLRRVALRGELLEIPDVAAVISMGEEESTTNYAHHPELSRWAREKILEDPRALERMRASATSSYWFGRIVRAYLTSAVWNIGRRRLFTFSSRLLSGFYILGRAGRRLATAEFWRAISGPYKSKAFQRGAARLPVSENPLLGQQTAS